MRGQVENRGIGLYLVCNFLTGIRRILPLRDQHMKIGYRSAHVQNNKILIDDDDLFLA